MAETKGAPLRYDLTMRVTKGTLNFQPNLVTYVYPDGTRYATPTTDPSSPMVQIAATGDTTWTLEFPADTHPQATSRIVVSLMPGMPIASWKSTV
jgi:hypothetical protein